MLAFMPKKIAVEVRAALRHVGYEVQLATGASANDFLIEEPNMESAQPRLRIGSVSCPAWPPEQVALVPATLFFEIPQHMMVMQNMLKDLATREHLLLMGNQGVGKNKLTDRLLMLLQREREYIQLHRDTTVGSLTLAPSLREGYVFVSEM